MVIGDMPNIAASAYGSNASTFALGGQGQGLASMGAGGGLAPTTTGIAAGQLRRIIQQHPPQDDAFVNMLRQQQQQKEDSMPASPRRLVQVFIADPDENLPLEKALLYKGEQKFTDSTDQELYFEIDIKSILDKHNEERAKTINKKVKERTEYLEPAKIRELKMVVVTIAQF